MNPNRLLTDESFSSKLNELITAIRVGNAGGDAAIIEVSELPTTNINTSFFYLYNNELYYYVNGEWKKVGEGAGGSSVAIIDVDELPTTDINNYAFYRLSTMEYYTIFGGRPPLDSKRNVINGYTVNILNVDTLPTTGTVFKDDTALTYTIYNVKGEDTMQGYSNGAWSAVETLFGDEGIWGGYWNGYMLRHPDEAGAYMYPEKVYIIKDKTNRIYSREFINHAFGWKWKEYGGGIIDVTELPSANTLSHLIDENKLYRVNVGDSFKLYAFSRKTFTWKEVGGEPPIIDVDILPETGGNSIYRTKVIDAGFYFNHDSDEMDGTPVIVHSVGRLPNIGKLFQGDDGNMNMYFQNSDNQAYVYVNYGSTEMWLEIGTAISLMFGSPEYFGGYVDIDNFLSIINDPRIFIIIDPDTVQTKLYHYKDGWMDVNNDEADVITLIGSEIEAGNGVGYWGVVTAVRNFKAGKRIIYKPSSGSYMSGEVVHASKKWDGEYILGIICNGPFNESFDEYPVLQIITTNGEDNIPTKKYINLATGQTKQSVSFSWTGDQEEIENEKFEVRLSDYYTVQEVVTFLQNNFPFYIVLDDDDYSRKIKVKMTGEFKFDNSDSEFTICTGSDYLMDYVVKYNFGSVIVQFLNKNIDWTKFKNFIERFTAGAISITFTT